MNVNINFVRFTFLGFAGYCCDNQCQAANVVHILQCIRISGCFGGPNLGYSPLTSIFEDKIYVTTNQYLLSKSMPNGNLAGKSTYMLSSESILTSPVLENFRKMDQLDRDESDRSRNIKAVFLLPILVMKFDIEKAISLLVMMNDANEYKQAALLNEIADIFAKDDYKINNFKKIFNRYSDNIYYDDPARANLYLAGGTTPTTTQTTQYLLRNQILTEVGNIRDDVSQMQTNGASGLFSVSDTIDDCNDALKSLRQYLSLADPNDVELGNQMLTKH